jgi:hypothetical protein
MLEAIYVSTTQSIPDSKENNSIRDVALKLAAHGIPAFPVNGLIDGRCSCGHANCRQPGKHPRIRWKDGATTDEQQIRSWWQQWPNSRVAIPTGKKSGITILDQNDRHGGDRRLAELESRYGLLPDTASIPTAGGGLHRWYKANGLRNSVGDDTLLGSGLDIRGDGGYAIVYELPDNFEIAEMPVWVKALAQKRRGSGPRLQGGFDPEQHRSGVPEGKRDNTLWSGACWHRAMDKPIEVALEWAEETALNSDFAPEIATEKVYRAYEQFEPNELYPESKALADFDPLREGITARDLQRKRFAPIRYAVDGYLPEGLTILGGEPKMGKSFMGLNLGVAKANGSEAFGEVPVTPGRAMILALEDSLGG